MLSTLNWEEPVGQPRLCAESGFPSTLVLGFGVRISWCYASEAGAWEGSNIQGSPTGKNPTEHVYVCNSMSSAYVCYSTSSLDMVENLDAKTFLICCLIRENFAGHWFPWFISQKCNLLSNLFFFFPQEKAWGFKSSVSCAVLGSNSCLRKSGPRLC